MKALKTIIATGVIVFGLTAVAMASVGHFTTTPSAKATGKTPVHYTVTLTAKQLAQLMDGQGGKATATRAAHQARRTHQRHHSRHCQNNGGSTYRSHNPSISGGGWSGTSNNGSQGSYRCYGNGQGGGGWNGGSGGSRSGGCGGCW